MNPIRACLAGVIVTSVCLLPTSPGGRPARAAAVEQDSTADWVSFTAAVDRLVAVKFYGLVPEAPGEPTAFGKVSQPGADGDPLFLLSALRSSDPRWRVRALRALGRLNEPADVAAEAPYLSDASADVRREAAHAIGESLRHREGKDYDRWMSVAFRELAFRVLAEPETPVAAAMFATIGQFQTRTLAPEIEDVLVRGTLPMSPRPRDFFDRQTAALRGLEAFIRRNGLGSGISIGTRRRLRQLAAPNHGLDDDVGPVLPALQALVLAGDTDLETILAAAAFRCSASRRMRDLQIAARADCGWEFRRLAFASMDPAKPEFIPLLRQGLSDPSFRVRIAALEAHARDRSRPKLCAPFLAAIGDRSIHVAVEATKLVTRECEETDQIETRLRRLANDLSDSAKARAWHLPLAALEALLRFDPAPVRDIVADIGLRHDAWQVRATAARLSSSFKDHELAYRLASDKHPNVRVEALLALRDLSSNDLVRLAIEALEPRDAYRPNYHVIATSAALLRDSRSDLILPAVMRVLAELNGRGSASAIDESSRDARLALLGLIDQSPDTSEAELNVLRGMLEDPDPAVALAAADIVRPRTAGRTRAVPIIRPADLATPVTPCVDIRLEQGVKIAINLEPDSSPIGVRTFLNQVDRQSYNGTTFHRAYPNAYLQGGSPQASDYAGSKVLIRDEIGPAHFSRGTVGLVQSGRHAGNMQLILSLVDAPHLDRNFTVLGTVGPCGRRDASADRMMDTLDAVKDGDRIVSITRTRDDDEN